MRIVCLNIRHGGGKRSPQILDWLNGQSADFVLLNEWRSNGSGAFLKTAMEETGYTCIVETKGAAANGLLAASMRAFSISSLKPAACPNGEIVAADFEILVLKNRYGRLLTAALVIELRSGFIRDPGVFGK